MSLYGSQYFEGIFALRLFNVFMEFFVLDKRQYKNYKNLRI